MKKYKYRPMLMPWTEDFVIKHHTKKRKNIVYGSKALNIQLPRMLHRKSGDWDIWSTKPARTADEIQAILDKNVGYDRYDDKLTYAYKKKVYRVIDKATGKSIADFTKTPDGANYVVIGGIRYQTLKDAKKAYKKILDDKKFAFRWDKARHDLWCIEHLEHSLKNGYSMYNLKHYPVRIRRVK